MSDDVCYSDRNEHGEENRMDLILLKAGAVKEDGNEANRHVQDLAGYLMAVNLCSSSVSTSIQKLVRTYK